MPAPGDYDDGEIGGMIGRGQEEYAKQETSVTAGDKQNVLFSSGFHSVFFK
jgi:hypothetical protein